MVQCKTCRQCYQQFQLPGHAQYWKLSATTVNVTITVTNIKGVPIFGTARVESQRSTLSTQPFQCWKTLVVTAVHRHLCVPVELHSFLSGIPSVSIGSSLDLVVLEVIQFASRAVQCSLDSRKSERESGRQAGVEVYRMECFCNYQFIPALFLELLTIRGPTELSCAPTTSRQQIPHLLQLYQREQCEPLFPILACCSLHFQ